MKRRLSISFAAMQDAVDRHTLGAVIDCEQHAIVADAEAVTIVAGQLLNLRIARVEGKLLDTVENQAEMLSGNPTHILFDAPIMHELVHELNQSLLLQALQQGSVGNGAAARLHSAPQCSGVCLVLCQPNQTAVVCDRQDNGLGLAASVDDDLLGSDRNGHDAASIAGAEQGVNGKEVTRFKE